jgi:hypothetical protein
MEWTVCIYSAFDEAVTAIHKLANAKNAMQCDAMQYTQQAQTKRSKCSLKCNAKQTSNMVCKYPLLAQESR